MRYKLDYAKAETLQLSNDAFFFIRDGEEPLDEDNLEEANEILTMFPYGFEIADDWQAIESTDMVEVTFIPYTEEEISYDMSYEIAKGYFYHIKFTQGNKFVKLWSYKESTGESLYKGEYELRVGALSKRKMVGFKTGDWRNGKGSLLWLKQFSERIPTKIPSDLPEGL